MPEKSNSFTSIAIFPELKHGFNPFDLAYWQNSHKFSSLISKPAELNNFSEQISKKRDFPYRTEISTILLEQYCRIQLADRVKTNIERLKSSDTYTVICAHQPCLMGGPLYWIYKIASTIKLCQYLEIQFPNKHFVPVYYCGSEDHDFEEINHFQIFNQKIEWKTNPGHAVGQLNANEISHVIETLIKMFSNSEQAILFLNKNIEWINQTDTYVEYYRHFVNELFGSYGLLFFNPDNKSAKKLFSPIIKKELLEQFIYTNAKKSIPVIENLGYQAQVNPRELNLFYHHAEGRKRMVFESGIYKLIDATNQWTQEEILTELESNPERFSPNVLLRPLFQDYLFPNLAFVGGGGEIAYWLELKACFDYVNIPYPLLFRRFSAIYFDSGVIQKISKTSFSELDFLDSITQLESKFVKNQNNKYVLHPEDFIAITKLLEKIKTDSNQLDQSTRTSIEAEIHKILKSLEHIENKHLKAIKNKLEQELLLLHKIKDNLFPNQSLQERFQNFLPYYFKHGQAYINYLIQMYEPSLNKMYLIQEATI
ncbi:MAG: bacillithiol biosynthesis cysteine-adding enzyme BshC [Saprospiraceae bacterium]|jgi:bacillithiol biosynthesis cysteine-adding enzyme BshC